MSEDNVQVVRAMLEPFNGVEVSGVDWEGDAIREAVERAYSPDVEVLTLESAVGIGPSRHYKGWEGLIRYLKEWFEPFSEYRMEYRDYIDEGDRIFVPMRAFGTGGASGIQVDMELILSYELRDGLITRLDQYDTLGQAREAAGQSE